MEEKCVYVVMSDVHGTREIIGIYENYRVARDWVMQNWKSCSAYIVIRKIALGHAINIENVDEDKYDKWVFGATIALNKDFVVTHDTLQYVLGDEE